MALAKTQVRRFSPKGLADTLDSTDTGEGSCAVLTNLIPDPTTKNIWICRPSSQQQTAFGSFNTPGAVVVCKVVGSWVYGLLTTQRNAGYDEPFAFNLATSTFATVANVTAANVPVTQSTTGDWTPPTMDLVGVNLCVTHPGFTGAGGLYFGWFDITDQANPRWHAGNLLANGAIVQLGAITPGTLYTTGFYPNVALTGGTGTGAKADITVAGGGVTIVSLDIAGKGYIVGDALSAAAGTIGGTGSAFSIPVVTVAGILPDGAILTFGTLTGGSGYGSGNYTNVPLTGGTGANATAAIVVAGGIVTSVTIYAQGNNYTAGDTLSASNANLGGMGSSFSIVVATVNTTGGGRIVFTTAPTWVRQFNGRGYFGINPLTGQSSVIFTDVLVLGCTNANQALTLGDNQFLIAAVPLGLSNQLGGIIQALMVFKDNSNIVQITGDYSNSTLSINTLNVAIGTSSPRSIVESPLGILFLAADGFRLLDFNATVNDPIGNAGDGVVVPFVSAQYPSRISAMCNGSILRVSLINQAFAWVEYWFDLVRKVWSGPHTFPSTVGDDFAGVFLFAPQTAPGTLYLGDNVPQLNDPFIENGTAMSWNMTTSVITDNQQMAQSEITELQIKTSVLATEFMTVMAQDQDGNVLNSQVYSFSPGSLWGTMIWGTGLWSSTTTGLAARRIDFPTPTVYNRLALQISGQCAVAFRIGDIYLRARALGYLQAVP